MPQVVISLNTVHNLHNSCPGPFSLDLILEAKPPPKDTKTAAFKFYKKKDKKHVTCQLFSYLLPAGSSSSDPPAAVLTTRDAILPPL